MSKCKDATSCSRARKGSGSPPEPRPQGASFPGQAGSYSWGDLHITCLNMDIRKDLHGCTPFGMLFYIAAIKRMSTTAEKPWGRGRQGAELAEGHSVSMDKQNPEGPERGLEEPFN